MHLQSRAKQKQPLKAAAHASQALELARRRIWGLGASCSGGGDAGGAVEMGAPRMPAQEPPAGADPRCKCGAQPRGVPKGRSQSTPRRHPGPPGLPTPKANETHANASIAGSVRGAVAAVVAPTRRAACAPQVPSNGMCAISLGSAKDRPRAGLVIAHSYSENRTSLVSGRTGK